MLLMTFIIFIGLVILMLSKSVRSRNLRRWGILFCLSLIVYGAVYELYQANKVENSLAQIQDAKIVQTTKPVSTLRFFNVGDTAKIDNFKYTLNNITDSITLNDSINCIILNITAENIGKEAKYLNSTMFKLKTSDGTIHESINALDDDSSLWDITFPYVPVTGSVAFEVPFKSTEMNYILEIQVGLSDLETVDFKLY